MTDLPCALRRHVDETARLYAVPEKRLDGRESVAGSRPVADIVCRPR